MWKKSQLLALLLLVTTGCSSPEEYKSFVQRSFSMVSAKIENVECLALWDSRAGLCTFSATKEEIDKLVSFFALSDFRKSSLVAKEPDIYTIKKDGFTGYLWPGSSPRSDSCTEKPYFGVKMAGNGKIIDKNNDVINQKYEWYVKQSVGIYTGNKIMNQKMGRTPMFKTLFFDYETGLGCMEVEYPYG
jgi:hypothetical protein